MRQTHLMNRGVPVVCQSLLLTSMLAVIAPAKASDGEPMFSLPTKQLSEVLPLRVLDNLELPPAPIRVAARPTLDWRPGLSATSKSITEAAKPAAPESTAPIDIAPKDSATKTEEKAERSDQAKQSDAVPPLQPVLAPPLLVAPNAGSENEQAPAAELVSPAETERLPLRQPRGRITPDTPKRPAPSQAAPAAKDAKPSASSQQSSEPEASSATPSKAKPPVSTKSDESPKKQATIKPAEPPQPLSRGLRNLRSRMRTVLSFYYRQPLNTIEHDPWELMHGMLAYELHSRVRDGGPKGPYMTSIGHLCFNRASKRQQMMMVDGDGRLDVRVGVGLQGHKGQLLAMLAQCNVSPEYPIRVDNRDFTIRDLVESEQRSCYAKTELTFKLIGLGHYLGADAEWLNEQGESWDIPRLIREEREQPIRGAACGGTHRLAGLSLAFRRREARGEPLDGEYAQAARFVSQYQSYAFKLQNDDGSMSTEWFRGPGKEEDIDRRLRTTGHLLEWLVYSLPDDQLRSYRTVKTVNYLTNLLAGNADHDWHLGSIGHALHALVLYDKRVFRPHDDDASKVAGAVDPTGRLFRSYPIYRNVMRNSPPKPSGIFGLFGGSRTGSAAGRRN